MIFLDAKRDVRVTVVIGGAAPIRAGRDVCLDGGCIVASRQKLYGNAREKVSGEAQIFLKSASHAVRIRNYCTQQIGVGDDGA